MTTIPTQRRPFVPHAVGQGSSRGERDQGAWIEEALIPRYRKDGAAIMGLDLNQDLGRGSYETGSRLRWDLLTLYVQYIIPGRGRASSGVCEFYETSCARIRPVKAKSIIIISVVVHST